MHWFYLASEFGLNSTVILSKEESFHLNKVLRLSRGETVGLLNGIGKKAIASIIDGNLQGSTLKILSIKDEAKKSKINMCLSLSKSAATELAIKKCSELGCRSFTFLRTYNSLSPKSWNMDRWQKLIIEVCKQSENAFFPELFPPIDLKTWLVQRNKNHILLFCDEEMRSSYVVPHSDLGYDILIGPEGGWREEERELISQEGGEKFGLGTSRLRCETAAIVALAVVKKETGEL